MPRLIESVEADDGNSYRPFILIDPDTGLPTAGGGGAGGGLGNSADMTFFTNRTTDGAVAIDWTGGPGLFSVYGVWGGATVQLAYSPNGGTTYIDTENASFSANATMQLSYPPGKVRATVASSSGTTSLSAKLQSTR